MDTKISSAFWSDPMVENLKAETRLAFLWLLTNSRLSICGYAPASAKRFAFETGLPEQALERAYEALAGSIVRVGEGYLVRRYIRHQFGTGNQLARSHMAKAIVKAMASIPVDALELLTAEYPELLPVLNEYKEKGHAMGIPLPSEGVRERERAREGEGDQGSDRGAGKGKGAAVLPETQPEPLRSRMLGVAECLRRRSSTAWSSQEIEALRAAGLADAAPEKFAEELALVRAYYHAEIKPEQDFRRRDVLRLCRYWPGEVDKADKWRRDNDDGLRRT